MYRLVLNKPEDDKLVTDDDEELISSRLKLAYEMGLQWLESKGLVPVKPAEMDEKEWKEKGWNEALEQLIKKTNTPKDEKVCGFIDIALTDKEAANFLNYINLPSRLLRFNLNRKDKRNESRLQRKQERYDEGLIKIKEIRKITSIIKKEKQIKKKERKECQLSKNT